MLLVGCVHGLGYVRYLEEEVENARNNATYRPWKPNCQLTPTATDIILGRSENIFSHSKTFKFCYWIMNIEEKTDM